MKAIIADDEAIMIRSFKRLTAEIEDIEIIGEFESGEDAISFVKENNEVEIAFLDVEMPGINGIDTAVELKRYDPKILIVFISAYDEYLRDSEKIGADHYIVKPYKKETLQEVMEKMRILYMEKHNN